MNKNDIVVLLYCFSYAGGNANVFKSWQANLPENIRVRPVELPGHGRRANEPLIESYQTLVEMLTIEITKDIIHEQKISRNTQYAGFGHSAGAALNFAVCSRLADRLQQPPVHCFLSAGLPPHLPKKSRSKMNDTELTAEIRALSGTPEVVLQSPALLNFFLPVLRADFLVYEGASLDAQRGVDCPLTLFAAAQDELPADSVWAWARYSSHPTKQVVLEGDHFSILQLPQEILSHICNDIFL